MRVNRFELIEKPGSNFDSAVNVSLSRDVHHRYMQQQPAYHDNEIGGKVAQSHLDNRYSAVSIIAVHVVRIKSKATRNLI